MLTARDAANDVPMSATSTIRRSECFTSRSSASIGRYQVIRSVVSLALRRESDVYRGFHFNFDPVTGKTMLDRPSQRCQTSVAVRFRQ